MYLNVAERVSLCGRAQCRCGQIDDQEDFGRYLARLTASAGFPFYWVENVEWLRFCQRFVPGAKPIKRRTLSRQNHSR